MSHMPVTLATDLVGFVMTFAACHNPAADELLLLSAKNRLLHFVIIFTSIGQLEVL